MAITKTGIIVSNGGSDETFEVNGQQSMVTASNLSPNTSYSVTAYVKDSYGRTTQSASSSQFTTLVAGTIQLTNDSTYDGTTCDVRYRFTSTYPISDVVVLNDKTKDFLEETTVTYRPTVSGTTSGSFSVQIRDPYPWLKIICYDMYVESNEEEIFKVEDL